MSEWLKDCPWVVEQGWKAMIGREEKGSMCPSLLSFPSHQLPQAWGQVTKLELISSPLHPCKNSTYFCSGRLWPIFLKLLNFLFVNKVAGDYSTGFESERGKGNPHLIHSVHPWGLMLGTRQFYVDLVFKYPWEVADVFFKIFFCSRYYKQKINEPLHVDFFSWN